MGPASRRLDLKDRQLAVLTSALQPPISLHYTHPSPSPSGQPAVTQPPWQVLIADPFARALLHALISPRNLRRHGITLDTQIAAPRGAVPDAPATYLISPSPENIAWVLKDIAARRYERISLAFTSAASPPLLAALASQMRLPSPVARVLDLHAHFIAVESNLFSLGMRDSFVSIKAIDDDAGLAAVVTPIVEGLLSACITLGLVPIIRAQRGGAAASVAAALDDAVRANLPLFRREPGVATSTFRRPLLLLLDRDFDFNAMMHHTWTYQALVHDIFPTALSSVTVPATAARAEQIYELDKGNDLFWAEKASAPFPDVAEGIEAALGRYKKDVEAVNARAGGEAAEPTTAAMAVAVASLPELAERKRNIDMHTNIATALLEAIGERALDTFFQLESEIMAAAATPGGPTSAPDYTVALMELLKGVRETAGGDKRGAGSATDRLRLFMIFYIAFGAQLTEEEMAGFRGALSAAGAPVAPIEYVGKICGYRHDLVTAPSREDEAGLVGSRRAMLRGMMTNVVKRGYRGIASVAQNAKDLIVENQRTLAAASILKLFFSDRARTAYSGSVNDVLDGYLLFDPKAEKGNGGFSETEDSAASERSRRMLFSDAILFVVGGGNFVEFENCMAAITPPPGSAESPNLIYGSTELVSSEQFLDQMAKVQAATLGR